MIGMAASAVFLASLPTQLLAHWESVAYLIAKRMHSNVRDLEGGFRFDPGGDLAVGAAEDGDLHRGDPAGRGRCGNGH